MKSEIQSIQDERRNNSNANENKLSGTHDMFCSSYNTVLVVLEEWKN